MEMSGEQRILAPREIVWAALNDPEVLKACIPGCQELARTSETGMSATVVLKVGPVSARFQGAVTLSDLDPPRSYRITGEGQGGVAGFAKGTALVQLEPEGEATLLRYEVTAEVGGKLAQLGARLIDATARQMSSAFFRRFAAEIAARQAAPAGARLAGAAGDTLPPALPAAGGDRVERATPAHRPWRPAHVAAILGAAAVAGYLGGAVHVTGVVPLAAGVSPDLAASVALLMAAALGYLFGRMRGGVGPGGGAG